MGRRHHEHHLHETAASADPNAGTALLACKDDQITTLDARLHETISRLSLVRARLLTTLDQLDALQATHSAALASAARERRLLEARVKEAEERAREGEKERMDMRDAVKVLVERVESTPDFSKWPRAQIHLSSPCEPSLISSTTSHHPNSTSNTHAPPSPSKPHRKAKHPPASSSSNQPPLQSLSLSPSAPNHQSDATHQSDQLAYASTLISHFRGERDAALVRLRESEERVLALEARVARRDVALEACAGCKRCLRLVGAETRGQGDEEGRRRNVSATGSDGELDGEVGADADILDVSIERNQELEREVQELARQLDRERISHRRTLDCPPSRGEQPPQTQTLSQPRIRTTYLSDPESPVSQPHARPRTPEPPSPLSPVAPLSPLTPLSPHSTSSPKAYNNPADNSLISSLSFSPSSSTSSTATSPSRRPGTAGTATPRQYARAPAEIDVAEQSFDSGVYDAEDEEEEQGHGRDQTRLDERPLDTHAEPPLDPGKADTDAVLFSAHVAAVPVPALHALEKEVARLGRKIDAFVVQRRDVERDLARYDAGLGDFAGGSVNVDGDGDVGDNVRRRRRATTATATTITSPAAAATTAPRREGSRTAAGGPSTDRGHDAGLHSEMRQRDRSAVHAALRNVGGGYMRAPAVPTGNAVSAEGSRERGSAPSHTPTLLSRSASPRPLHPAGSPSRSRSRSRPHSAAAAAGDQAQTPVVEYAHPHHGACEATLLAARRREMELREKVRVLEEQLQVQRAVGSEGVERSEHQDVEGQEQGESAERPRQLVEEEAPLQQRECLDTAVQTEPVLSVPGRAASSASVVVENSMDPGSNLSQRGTESGDAGPTERDEMAERVHDEVVGEEEGEMPMELATPLVPLRSFVAEPEDEVVGGEDGEDENDGERRENSGHGPASDSEGEPLDSSGRPDEAMGASEGGTTPPPERNSISSPVSNHEDAPIATRPNTPSPTNAGPSLAHPRQRSGSLPHEQSPPTTRPSAPSPPSSPEGSPTIAVGLLPPLLPNAHLSLPLPLPLSLPLLHAPRSSARSPHPTSTSGANSSTNSNTNTTVARTRVFTNTRTATSMGLRRAHTDTALQNNWDADADAEARRAGAVHRFVLYRATSSFVAELREVERNLAERAVEAQVHTEAQAQAEEEEEEEEEKDVRLPEESRDELEADETSGPQANVDASFPSRADSAQALDRGCGEGQ